MADYRCIAATGESLARFLNHAFRADEPLAMEGEDPANVRPTNAVLVRTEDLQQDARSAAIGSPALSIFLYRADFNKTMRAAWSAVGGRNGTVHLPLDLHVLLTPWATNANYEHRILGRAMQALETTPILSGPLLDRSAHWSAGEAIQLCLQDIPTEDLMRIFDSLPLDYKLSVPYIARIVRIDARAEQVDLPVTTSVVGITPSTEEEA